MANKTITGKIFTLKDPTGNYDRFPRTVMEAVYGLNTYLQNQFSALADIYMPIEGITESKPLQEFVYRLCPSSIKAKSVSLDRIYGKTLAWNQLRNGGEIKISGTFSVSAISASGGNFSLVSGHKYLVRASDSAVLQARFRDLTEGLNPGFNNFANGYTILSYNISSNNSTFLQIQGTNGESFDTFINITDLTLLYGSAIDGKTDAQILAMYEADFGTGYHAYSAGKLISNDAESIETVGFNQWDEEWENAFYPNGVKTNTPISLGSKNLVPVLRGQTYFFKVPNPGGQIFVCYYDANGNYISGHSDYTDSGRVVVPDATRLLTIPADVNYIRFSYYYNGQTLTYNHDICINLSDPTKNGTYEPYRKSVMQLNLGSFQVRDSQGNVTTITGGLKSAGSVRDEIVGNKYIQRVTRVHLGGLTWSASGTYATASKSSFKAAASAALVNDAGLTLISSGVSSNVKSISQNDNNINVNWDGVGSNVASAMAGKYMDIELATPIEYELVSPLVPTVKAGETEARISPNSDGLSAPMVADMTYDAQANNDSASAQYALTAGRLLNSHKLWGQDFDGTQDVTGALTGVTSITMNGALSGVTTLGASGAVTLGSTLSVAGNTTVGGTLGVTGATTLTGALTANGAASINNTLTVGTAQTNRATTLNGTLSATGAATFGSTLTVTSTSTLTGRVGIGGAPDSTNALKVTGVAYATTGMYSDGYITAGAVNSSSDARLKDNIKPFFMAMDILPQIKPREWDWNDKTPLEGHSAGFVAQEIQSVMPYAVEKHGEFLSLNYNVFHALEVSALQNHEERIKALEAENAELRRRLGA